MRKQCVCVVLMAILALIQGGAAYGAWNFVEDPNLVGWWPLDEGVGATTADASGNAPAATFFGDPNWVAGWFGTGLEFDGDDYVDTGVTKNLANFTVAIWAKSPAAPANAAPAGPIHREANFQVNWNHTQDAFRAAVGLSAGGWHGASFGALEADTWYHLAGTYDGEDLKAYKNGELITTNSAPTGPAANDARSLKLGRHAASATQFFTGTVDDAQVYSRALAAEEIQAIMKGVSGAGLAEWENTVAARQPAFFATDVADGMYDIGVLGGEVSYEFVVQSNPDETQASMALLGQGQPGVVGGSALKYEQWSDTGGTKTYGATIFGVADYDFLVPTAPGIPTHLVYVASLTTGKTDLYVNGVYRASVDAAVLPQGLVGIGYAAQAADGSDAFDNFDGQILGVAIYNRVLSKGEIRAHSDAYSLAGPSDITTPGDAVQGIPTGLPCGGNANTNYTPCGELPPLVIDNSSATKYLNFGGNFGPNEPPSGFQVTPALGATIVTGMTFTTANDAAERDPTGFELYGSNESIDGPYELIAAGQIADFNQADAWPRFTMNATPIAFENTVAYLHYQVLFTAIRNKATANSMQIAEVELIGVPVLPALPEPPAEALFADDFEAYAAGSALAGQGGWKGWDNVDAAGAPASSAKASSGANSVEITGAADLVHEFAIAGGKVEFSAMQFIPAGSTGNTFFILLNQYGDGAAPDDWSVQLNFNLGTGVVTAEAEGGNATANIVVDKWVELKFVIDLDANTCDWYYDGVLVKSHAWDNDAHGTLQAIDLFGNNASPVYYDDITVK